MDRNFCKILKQLRLEAGKTQEEMSKLIGIKRSTYGEYERGRITPPIDKLEHIAKVFDVTPAHMMGWKQEAIASSGEILKQLTVNMDEQEAKVIADIHAVNVVAGNTLKYYRTQNKKTLEEMSEELHIPVILLTQYENGSRKIPFEIVQKLADYFHIDTTLLIGLDLKKKDESNNDFKESVQLLGMVEKWNKEIGRVHFTDDELDELINFAKYLLSKRNT